MGLTCHNPRCLHSLPCTGSRCSVGSEAPIGICVLAALLWYCTFGRHVLEALLRTRVREALLG